jgi:hypothetical protein
VCVQISSGNHIPDLILVRKFLLFFERSLTFVKDLPKTVANKSRCFDILYGLFICLNPILLSLRFHGLRVIFKEATREDCKQLYQVFDSISKATNLTRIDAFRPDLVSFFTNKGGLSDFDSSANSINLCVQGIQNIFKFISYMRIIKAVLKPENKMKVFNEMSLQNILDYATTLARLYTSMCEAINTYPELRLLTRRLHGNQFDITRHTCINCVEV